MRKALAITLGGLLVLAFAAFADAKSHKACDIGCSKYTGGQKGSMYTKCMEKCALK